MHPYSVSREERARFFTQVVTTPMPGVSRETNSTSWEGGGGKLEDTNRLKYRGIHPYGTLRPERISGGPDPSPPSPERKGIGGYETWTRLDWPTALEYFEAINGLPTRQEGRREKKNLKR